MAKKKTAKRAASINEAKWTKRDGAWFMKIGSVHVMAQHTISGPSLHAEDERHMRPVSVYGFTSMKEAKAAGHLVFALATLMTDKALTEKAMAKRKAGKR